MNVGWVGLGKLGLPCALALASKGHTVVGTDTNPEVREYLADGLVPYEEAGVADLFAAGHRVEWRDSIHHVVAESDVIFVAVQTPHAPEYEGVTPLPDTRRDFEYGYLIAAFREIAAAARASRQRKTVVIISTVLPGTVDRHLRPLVNGCVRLVYNPFFIAMGTAVADFLEPEFVLLGTDDPVAQAEIVSLYETVHRRPIVHTSVATAELVKVAYNTFIGLKVVFGNALMEVAHKTGADCDEAVRALSFATDRLLSPKYLRGGMGDGGGCHPRDNIALSWLAERLDLSFDLFGTVMRARQAQSAWLGQLAQDWADITRLPVYVIGSAYKAESNLSVGSPARLLATQMGVKLYESPGFLAAVFVIGVNHARYAECEWPAGSVVIDPWGYIPDQPGVTVVRVGRK